MFTILLAPQPCKLEVHTFRYGESELAVKTSQLLHPDQRVQDTDESTREGLGRIQCIVGGYLGEAFPNCLRLVQKSKESQRKNRQNIANTHGPYMVQHVQVFLCRALRLSDHNLAP